MAVLGGTLLAVSLASAAQQAFPGKPGKLVFQSNRDGNYELYVANANGSGVKRLLSRPQSDEFNANWSPSGAQLVFQTGPPDRSTYDIWIVSASGKGAKPLVAGATNDLAPQFCDEKTVVFTRRSTATNSEVYAVGTDGKGLRRLTNHPASDSFPTCNPKGTRVAFISSRDGPPRVYEMTRAGGGLRAIADGVDPDYSADGKTLAYVAPDADRNLEVFVKNLATGAILQRTNVKAPLEYRLPKNAPGGAVVATQRNTQTSAERVEKVTGSGATTLAEDGSGGAPQYLGPCSCEKLDVRVVNATRQVGVREGEERSIVRIDVRWTMTCTEGAGSCKAYFTPVAQIASGFSFGNRLGKAGQNDVNCVGPCRRTASGTDRLQGTGLPGVFSFKFEVLRTNCTYERRPLAEYTLVFTKSGRLDREASELNGRPTRG
jgi:TolB protein